MAYKAGKIYTTKKGETKAYPKKNLVTLQLDDVELAMLESLKSDKAKTRVAVIRQLLNDAAK